EGLSIETVRLPGRTPVILMEVPGTSHETILLYGHCDKQPEMIGWGEGLGPWTPVRRGDRLYGRGAQDDGYAAFCALTAIEAVQRAGAPHARLIVLIEGSEESGSPDLPACMEARAAKIGEPDLVICLDSGCGNYDQLWGTTSLRGVISALLTVEVLTEGVHSGAASGIVPSSFRIARQLLSRVEDERSGALVRGETSTPSPGWDAPATEPWLLEAVQVASERHFGRPAMFKGLGGSIPFMAMLGDRFPRAQFFITGTGGPGSNAHGPNEFLHVPYAQRLP